MCPHLEENDIRRFVVNGSGSPLATDKSLKDMLADIEGSDFATATDSLKVLSDVLDTIEGSGFNTATDSLKVLSDMLDTLRTELTFAHQADASLNQSWPNSDELYTVLDTTANVRLIAFAVKETHSVTPTNVKIVITIDGQTLTYTKTSPSSATWYFPTQSSSVGASSLALGSTDLAQYLTFLYEGRSVKVQASVSGGTVSNLSAIVKYAKR
jgi:hypothetical protein